MTTKRKITAKTATNNGEDAIAAIIASAPLNERTKLAMFAASYKWLHEDSLAHGGRPPEATDEYFAAMDTIEDFMLAQRPSHDVTMDVAGLLDQLFTDARKFPKLLLKKLSDALTNERQRIAALETTLLEVAPEVGFTIFESYANITKGEVESVLLVVRGDLEHYDGEVDDLAAFTCWIMGEVEHEIRYRAEVRAQERARHDQFLDLYGVGKKAVFAGVWEVLKTCLDLGATRQEAEEVAQITWVKIWEHLAGWEDDGTASIPTRLRKYAHDQGRGWRTQRIRNRDRFRSLFYADLSGDERRTYEEKRAA